MKSFSSLAILMAVCFNTAINSARSEAFTQSHPDSAFLSKDIISLPQVSAPGLSKLQKNCAQFAATKNYGQAEKNCRLLLTRLKESDKAGETIPHVMMCSFYVGLLSETIGYVHHRKKASHLTQMAKSVAEQPVAAPSTLKEEQAFINLIGLFDIKVNIEKSCKLAAYHNSGYAMEILGDYYEENQHYDDAIYWYRRAIETYGIAPQNGGISAAYALGTLFALAPRPTGRQPERAAALFLQSVLSGDDSFIGSYLNHEYCKNCLPLATRRQIQILLKQQNLYQGHIDGDFGSNTIKAIMELYHNPKTYPQAREIFRKRANYLASTGEKKRKIAHKQKPKILRRKSRHRPRLRIKKPRKVISRGSATLTTSQPPSWLSNE